jgi:ribosomal silencing factor RsfS
MTTESAAKKDTQKLQRAIVDGLEDVKAQDIQVFNTEHLSPLFERVIIASGTSNRQTKALAASVRDAVREAGFPKPRIEGETTANGSSWTAAPPWRTSCSRPSASTTTWKKSGATSRCA